MSHIPDPERKDSKVSTRYRLPEGFGGFEVEIVARPSVETVKVHPLEWPETVTIELPFDRLIEIPAPRLPDEPRLLTVALLHPARGDEGLVYRRYNEGWAMPNAPHREYHTWAQMWSMGEVHVLGDCSWMLGQIGKSMKRGMDAAAAGKLAREAPNL